MMEQHPIPQDITGFKFKLVGDMTLKQFGFLATGSVIAWIFYSTPWYAVIKLPLALFSFLAGLAFAFLPIEDRPMEVWVVNFFKSIYRPTFLVWRRANDTTQTTAPLINQALPKPKLPDHLNLLPGLAQLWPFTKKTTDVKVVPKKAEEPLKTEEQKVTVVAPPPLPEPLLPILSTPDKELEQETTAPVSLLVEEALPPKPVASPFASTIEELEKIRAEKLAQLEEERSKLEHKEEEIMPVPLIPSGSKQIVNIDVLERTRIQSRLPKPDQENPNIAQGEKQLNELLLQNQNLQDQINQIRSKVAELSGAEKETLTATLEALNSSQTAINSQIVTLQKTLTDLKTYAALSFNIKTPGQANVKVVSPQPVRSSQTLSLTEIPNVVSGLLRGAKGEAMEGVIVLIKDKAGNAIRALKTNKIGQFITNTPLENGSYFLEMEKSGTTFDVLEISLTGQILPVLEITAKANGPV